MFRNIIIVLSVILIVVSCNQGGKKNVPDFTEMDTASGELEIAEESMAGIVENISSPVEMAALMKSLEVPFSKKYLASTEYMDNYNTGFKQALNLGIFGADLGYLNMYNKTSTVLDYIQVIKQLADALRVGQFFDFSTLKRLATNNQNLDSLMYISVHSFNQMDKYLRENNRSNLSALIVAGVWIEGMYLATQVAKESDHPEIAERIGEQKIILGDLMIILNNYKKDPQFAKLISMIEEIKTEFDGVKITYEMGEPEAVEQDGMLVIIQNETSIVNISKEQLSSIIAKTEEVRNKLIQL